MKITHINCGGDTHLIIDTIICSKCNRKNLTYLELEQKVKVKNIKFKKVSIHNYHYHGKHTISRDKGIF